MVIVTGGISSGSLYSTYEDEDVYLVLEETVGIPGFTYDFIFGEDEDVPSTAIYARMRGWYDGNPAHIIKLQQWNYTTEEWTNVTSATRDFPQSAEEMFYNFDLIDDSDYLSGGQIKLRITHLSAGNITHLFHIDHLYLTQETPAQIAFTATPRTFDFIAGKRKFDFKAGPRD